MGDVHKQLRLGDNVLVDAPEGFERLAREGRLEEAIECHGDLLPGLDGEWVYEARESHRHRFGDVLASPRTPKRPAR